MKQQSTDFTCFLLNESEASNINIKTFRKTVFFSEKIQIVQLKVQDTMFLEKLRNRNVQNEEIEQPIGSSLVD